MENNGRNTVGLILSVAITMLMILPAGAYITANEEISGEGGAAHFIVEFVGPIIDEWAESIKDLDVEIITYMSDNSYEVRMTPTYKSTIENLPFVKSFKEYPNSYKISPGLDGNDVIISLIVADTLDDTVKELQGYMNEVFVQDYTVTGYVIRGTVADSSTIDAIAAFPDVHYIGPYIENELHDESGMQQVGGYLWYNDPDSDPATPYRDTGTYGTYVNHQGWTGNSVLVGLADTGIGDGTTGDANHVDFQNRVVGGTWYGASTDWADGHGHGTHCAGLALGNGFAGTGITHPGFGPYYAGMGLAYDADVFGQKIFSDAGGWEGPADYYTILEDACQAGVMVHSNSWGSATGGAYSDHDEAYDEAVRDADSTTPGNQQIIITVSAGNSGPGTNSIGSPGNGKNVITVGATENYWPDMSSYGNGIDPDTDADNPDTIIDFSSRGWTDDGRIKPDVVAAGSGTLSLRSTDASIDCLYGTYTVDDRYEWCSGTSQSNPTVAGAVAVIYEWYLATYGQVITPAMAKAFAINTAVDMGPADVPNQDEGWGRMYLPTIMDPPAPFLVSDTVGELTTGVTDVYEFFYDNSAEPLKVTLAYTDTYALTGANPSLQNQVNLELESPLGTIYKGNAFSGGWSQGGANPPATFDPSSTGRDTRNNVECVFIPPGSLESGQYTVRVIGTNVPTDCDNDGTNDQDYALVVYNAQDVTSQGVVDLDQNIYLGEDTALVSVADLDLDTDNTTIQTTSVVVDSTTEPGGESVLLTETAVDSATFEGTLTLSLTDGAGILQVSHADIITATYNDADNGTGSPDTVTDTATVDAQAPQPPTALTVEWWGQSVQTIYSEDFEGDGSPTFAELGWTLGGANNDWEIDDVGGQGGDPAAAAGGSWWIGNDLTGLGATAGQYENSVPADDNYIYSPAIDCTVCTSTTLEFYRWLGVESATWDHASIEVSNDGAAWTTVWDHGGGSFTDSAWTLLNYDISTVADNEPTVYVRFQMGPTDGSVTYCGWNVDDLHVEGLVVGGTDDNCLNWSLSLDDGFGDNDVVAYNIYRANNEFGPWDAGANIDSVLAGTIQYIDLGRGEFDGTNWWYVVRAEDAAGNEEQNTVAVPEMPVGNVAPSTPTNPIPAHMAVGVGLNPALSVDVSDPNGDSMDVSFYDASGPTLIGTDFGVSSPGTASVNWLGLSADTTYNWFAVADDGALTTQSPTWQFTTMDTTPPAPPTGLTVEWWGATSTTWIDEDFSGGVPPAGWNIYTSGTTGTWSQQATTNAGGTSPEARFIYGLSGIGTSIMYAGPFDTVGLITMDLQWQNMIDDYAAGTGVTCKIQTSSDATSWVDTGWAWDDTVTPGDMPAALESIVLDTDDVGSSTFYLGWTIDGNSYQLNYWYIDDVLLTSTGGGTTDDNWLNWTLSADDGGGANDVDHYNIYRANNAGGPWDAGALIDTVPAGTDTYMDFGRGQPDGINWWYVVRAEDVWGNEELNTIAVPEIGVMPTYDIDLTSVAVDTWVFVSFPIEATGDVTTVFDDAFWGSDAPGDEITWDYIQWYDNLNKEWRSYSIYKPAPINDLDVIGNTYGFWIHITANPVAGDEQLTVGSGIMPAAVPINLYTGWNLVGYPSATPRAGDLTLPAEANLVSVYDLGQAYRIRDELKSAVTFTEGNAYWVRVTADCVWTVNP